MNRDEKDGIKSWTEESKEHCLILWGDPTLLGTDAETHEKGCVMQEAQSVIINTISMEKIYNWYLQNSNVGLR